MPPRAPGSRATVTAPRQGRSVSLLPSLFPLVVYSADVLERTVCPAALPLGLPSSCRARGVVVSASQMKSVKLRELGRSPPTSQLSSRRVGPSTSQDKVISLLKSRQEVCTLRRPFPSRASEVTAGAVPPPAGAPFRLLPEHPFPVSYLRRRGVATATASPGDTARSARRRPSLPS